MLYFIPLACNFWPEIRKDDNCMSKNNFYFESMIKMVENKVANKGDRIRFERLGYTIIGEVVRVKEESVLVSISEYDAERLKIDTPITVVSHKNYKLLL